MPRAGTVLSREQLERNRETSREAKSRRRGVCVDCGAETRYNGTRGQNGPSLRCRRCGQLEAGRKQAGQGHVQQRLYELLRHGVTTRAGLLEHGVASGNVLQATLHREVKAGRIVRTGRGSYALAAGEGGEV